FSPKDADAWRKTGFDKAFEAQNYVKADIDLKKAAQWKQGGFNIRECSSFNDVSEATAYIELGETPSAAVNWKDLKQSPEQVKAWKEAGVSSFHQAKQWLDEQVDRPQEAASWIQAGISSVQDVKAWKEAGFSAETSAAWRAAGFVSLEGAMTWRDKGYDDPALAAVERRHSPEFVKGFLTRLMFIAKDRPQDVVIQLGVNTDLLNKQFLSAFTEVAKSMMPSGEKERIYFADLFGWIADCLRRLLNDNPTLNIELALGCLLALQEMLKDNFPGPARVQIEFWIAKALISRQKGDKSKNIEKALSMLLEIDKLVNNVTSPKFWAEIQQGIGWGLYERQAGERRKNLLIAVKRYEAALTVFTKEKYPTDHDFTRSMQAQAQEALSSL
ncbi:MAG: hypothetical protein GY801_32915, partial [bacterium]|nr:hypothetical protein [bacterium]